jgi:photosystem II stability/assembly factor-like uncharacterized protein
MRDIRRSLRNTHGLVVALVSSATLLLAADLPRTSSATELVKAGLRENYGNLPLSFVENRGQANARIRFLSHGNGYSLLLTPGAVVLNSAQSPQGHAAALEMTFSGAQSSVSLTGQGRQSALSSYFIGNDSTKWISGIPNYSSVRYRGLYRGVDLVLYGNQRQLEYDFVVAPGADSKTIQLLFDGASQIRLDTNGDLVLSTAFGEIRQHTPNVYQESNGLRQTIEGHWRIGARNRVGFEIAKYDHRKPLVIDPVLSYASYLGSPGFEAFGNGQTGTYPAIAVDSQGNAYLTGYNGGTAADFGPSGAITLSAPSGGSGGGGVDAFVSKFNSSGTALVYSVVFGGGVNDVGTAIAVDRSGNAFITGYTSSSNFPVSSSAAQPALNGTTNAFVTEVNSAGTALIYSTYLGSGTQSGYSIALDGSDNAYVAGAAQSGSTGFLTKVNSNGTQFLYSLTTDFGPAYGVAVDLSGNAFITGSPGGYVAAVSNTGSGFNYGPYYLASTSYQTTGYAIAVDSQDNTYVTGMTNDPNFATPGLAQATYGGGSSDAFAAKLNSSGALLWATYIGGLGSNPYPERGSGIGLDALGNIYVAGTTQCIAFPVTNSIPHAQSVPAALLTSSNSASSWSANSLSGRFDRVDAVATNGSIIYAGAAAVSATSAGGIYESTNGGSTWQQLTSGSVDALAVDPANATIVYAVVEGHIYVSQNSGATWSGAPGAPAVGTSASIAINSSGTEVYVGSSTGLVGTTNSGATWTTVSGVPAVNAVVIDSSGNVYAATNNGIYKNGIATNNGLTSLAVTGLAVTGATIYAVSGTPGELFYTTNGGAGWTGISLGAEVPEAPVLVAVDTATPSNLYVALQGGGVLASTNGGSTWTALTYQNGLTHNQVTALVVNPGSHEVFAGIITATDAFVTEISPSGGSFVYSTCLGGADNNLGQSLAMTPGGGVYVSGATASLNLPVTPGAPQSTLAGGYDAFVAGINVSEAELTSPVTGGTLSDTSGNVSWTAVSGATQYQLTVGTTPGGTNLFSGTVTGTSQTVNNIPCPDTGGTIYVELSAKVNNTFLPTASYTNACRLGFVDFNHDGHADIVWQASSGQSQTWFLGGSQGVSLLGYSSISGGNSWRIVGSGDFNSDGTPDLLWQDPVSGAAQVWFMGGPQGNQIIGASTVSGANPWTIVAVADFNRDGHPDIAWQDPVSGWVQIWYLGGAQGVTFQQAANITESNPWQVAGAADFNGDGIPDVLWQDPVSGAAQIWYMTGSLGNVVSSAITLTGPNAWRIGAVADFNLDGHPDLVWQDPASGTSQVWFLTGAQGTSVLGTAPLSGPNPWRIVNPR